MKASVRLGVFVAALACSNQASLGAEVIDIEPVWSAHPVGFCLLTHKGSQFVAYYNAEREMTVAARKLPETAWQFVKLPEKVKWDSHNYITMTMDDSDQIHLSGNMHGVPLVYFRTKRPMDISSFERIDSMTSQPEAKCTYPQFMRGTGNELIFTYRDGGSGKGNQHYNVYDPKTLTWKPLMDGPLTDGQGRMNAYFHGPTKGPDGFFHLAWVWRDSGDCSTNHDLCYARSRDLVRWETSTGSLLQLPIRLDTAEIVDPVPAKGGMINGNTVLGFDSQKRPMITYHKYDEKGLTQIWQARLDSGKWTTVRSTDWDYRWDFSGGGTIDFKVGLGGIRPGKKGELRQNYKYPGHDGTWIIDEETLKVKSRDAEVAAAATSTSKKDDETSTVSTFPGMRGQGAGDSGSSGEAGVSYRLRWETLPPNNDRARKPPLPAPSMLQVVRESRS